MLFCIGLYQFYMLLCGSFRTMVHLKPLQMCVCYSAVKRHVLHYKTNRNQYHHCSSTTSQQKVKATEYEVTTLLCKEIDAM